MTGRRGDRAFARAHHPGVGGDPAVFAAGLARFREPESRAEAPVTFVARHCGTAARSSRTAAARAHRRGVSAVSARRRVALFARHRPAAPFTRRRVAKPVRRRGSAAFLSRFRRRPPRVR